MTDDTSDGSELEVDGLVYIYKNLFIMDLLHRSFKKIDLLHIHSLASEKSADIRLL